MCLFNHQYGNGMVDSFQNVCQNDCSWWYINQRVAKDYWYNQKMIICTRLNDIVIILSKCGQSWQYSVSKYSVTCRLNEYLA